MSQALTGAGPCCIIQIKSIQFRKVIQDDHDASGVPPRFGVLPLGFVI